MHAVGQRSELALSIDTMPPSSAPIFRSRLATWLASVGSFAVAAALQITIFRAMASPESAENIPTSIRVLLAALWLALPALAVFLAFRVFRLIEKEPARRSIPALVALILLPMLSTYLSLLISFNTWGGK